MLEARGVTYSIEGKEILSNVSLSLEKGESLALMGPTGAGKSTLLFLLAGLLKGDEGEVLIDGVSILKRRRRREEDSVAIIFQSPERMFFLSTVRREAEYSIKRLSKAEREERIAEALRLLGLKEDILTKHPLSLSGGEKRKVALMTLLVRRSGYLFFDEPIAGLDPASRSEFLDLLDLFKSEGKAVVIATHNAEAAECMGRLVVLEKGRLIFNGTMKEAVENGVLERACLPLPPSSQIARELGLKGYHDPKMLERVILERYR